MCRFSLRIIGLLMLGGLVSSVAAAQEPRVLVLGFSGAGGSTARVQVLHGLRSRASFAKKADAERIAASEGLELYTDDGREALCKELNVDYVFWGRVNAWGPDAYTEIRVAGRSGRQLTSQQTAAPGTAEGNELIQQAASAALTKSVEVSASDHSVEEKGKKRKRARRVRRVRGASGFRGLALGKSPRCLAGG